MKSLLAERKAQGELTVPTSAICPQCGQPVQVPGPSSDAWAFCPRCQTGFVPKKQPPSTPHFAKTWDQENDFPPKKESWVKRHFGLLVSLLLVLVVLGFISSFNRDDSQTNGNKAKEKDESNKPLDYKMSAQDLAWEFEANSIAADAKYKGKVIEVHGFIADIRTVLGSPTVQLTDGFHILGVSCEFRRADKGQVMSLTKGREVTIRGTCGGKVLNVLLKKCSVR
jgi:hypothetical protein